jgi:hypothetical protein
MSTLPHLAGPATWLALLAATTLGSAEFGEVRARIHADVAPAAASYRLIVHSYAPSSLDAAGKPGRNARPIGSIQRAVTSEELSRGVLVSVMQIGEKMAESPVLIAWVEPGEPTLELDARTATPHPDAVVGVTRAGGPLPVDLKLGRRA